MNFANVILKCVQQHKQESIHLHYTGAEAEMSAVGISKRGQMKAMHSHSLSAPSLLCKCDISNSQHGTINISILDPRAVTTSRKVKGSQVTNT